MTAVKGGEADRFVARPPADARFILVYGPDSGLVAERVTRLVKSFRSGNDDPFAFVQLDGSAVASDPNRLLDEALTISLFGGRRTLLVRDIGPKSAAIAPIFQSLMKTGIEGAVIIAEGGDLAKSNPMRTLFERDRAAHALPCYLDDEGAIARLIDEELKLSSLAIEPDARRLLAGLLGGDRLVSRGEVQKLCLYAAGAGTVTVDHVTDVIADASAVTTDEIIDAAALGDLATLGDRLARAYSEGITPAQIATTALRHFQMIDKARGLMDGGATASSVVDGMRPPVFYKRRDKVTKAINLWAPQRLQTVLQILGSAARDTRLSSRLDREIMGEALFTIARAAGRRPS